MSNDLTISQGFASPLFAEDSVTATLEAPVVLALSQASATVAQAMPILEHALMSRRPLLVIAPGFDEELFVTICVNSVRQTMAVAAVEAPGAVVSRVAAATNASVLTAEDLSGMRVADLGEARRIIITAHSTVIQGGRNERPTGARVSRRIGDGSFGAHRAIPAQDQRTPGPAARLWARLTGRHHR